MICDVSKIIELYSSGMSVREVGDALGISASTVSRRLRGAKATLRPASRLAVDLTGCRFGRLLVDGPSGYCTSRTTGESGREGR